MDTDDAFAPGVLHAENPPTLITLSSAARWSIWSVPVALLVILIAAYREAERGEAEAPFTIPKI